MAACNSRPIVVGDVDTVVDYHDERTGIWTQYRIERDRIVIVRGRSTPHWIAAVLSALILLALLVGVIRSPELGGLPLLGFGLVMLLAWLAQRKFDKTRFPLVISKVYETDLREMRRGRMFDAALVQQIIVRENSRREVDDSHLVQIYMQLEQADSLVLLHQDYYSESRVNRINRIADDFRNWLNYPEQAEAMRLLVRASALESKREFEDALALADQAVSIDPNSPKANAMKSRLEELLRRV